MALLTVDFRSAKLKRNVSIQVVLPYEKFKAPYPTLYLLHGLKENNGAWLYNTSIRRLAENNGFAVVMPSGENSFYMEVPVENGCYGDFGSYIGEELVAVTREMFPLSKKREDTFIGGLSMGGFGACRNGLKYKDVFSKVAVFSGALHFFEYDEQWVKTLGNTVGELEDFGDLEKARETDKNPRFLMKKIDEENKKDGMNHFPEFYVCCGTEDSLIDANRSIAKALKEYGAQVTYREGPGGHHWEFWEVYIRYVVEWLNVTTEKK